MKQYKWKILSLWVAPHENGLDDVVKSVNWCYRVTEALNYGEKYETTKLEAPSSDDYIKYENLNEEQVISWIKNNIDYDKLVSDVDSELEKNKNPEVIEKMNPPWNQDTSWVYIANREYMMVIDDEINNEEKTIGPMYWNSVDFNDSLKEKFEMYDITIPDNATIGFKELLPAEGVIYLNDRVKIYSVIDIEPNHDVKFQKAEKLEWEIIKDVLHRKYDIVDLSLEELKERIKESIKSDSFQSVAHLIDDWMNLSALDSSIEHMNDDETIEWTVDGVFKEWTKSELKEWAKIKSKEFYSDVVSQQKFWNDVQQCQSVQEIKDLLESRKNNKV